jgi:L-fuculose-phosphate aldolase
MIERVGGMSPQQPAAGGEAEARAAVVATARAMSAAGLSPGKAGNVSCRWEEGFLITPSGLAYDRMEAADIARLDARGEVIEALRKPSSEAPLHAAIYAARPEAGAVVHTHSPQATALACARRAIPAFHYMVAVAGGADIRCAPYATFGSRELAAHALAGLDGRRATLLANHGVVTLGPSLQAALALAAEVENLAGQYLALLASGLEPVLLDEAEMTRVLDLFKDYGR